MKFNFSDAQKQQFVTAVVTFILTLAAIFFRDQTEPKPAAPPASGGVNVETVQPAITYRALTVQNDLTVGGKVLFATGAITSVMVNDISRSVELPLGGWQECTVPAAISWTDGTDTKPVFAKVNNSPAIAYDATAGSVDTDLVCNAFVVPPDFAGGAVFSLRVTQGAATVTNIESASCTVGIDGAAQGAAGTANLVNQTAVQSVTVVPAGTFAAGGAVGVNCKQGTAAADDAVNILSVEFRYTATQ